MAKIKSRPLSYVTLLRQANVSLIIAIVCGIYGIVVVFIAQDASCRVASSTVWVFFITRPTLKGGIVIELVSKASLISLRLIDVFAPSYMNI